MGRPRRNLRAAVEEATSPPDELMPHQQVARLIKAEGDNRYSCLLPSQKTVLVELASRFHKTIWLKRGGYVIVQLTPAEEMTGKVEGEIVNIVSDEKPWRKQSYWPEEFAKDKDEDDEDDEEEESTVGKLPPSDSEDDY
ncbi:putative S1-like domain-containing protein [Xylaria sp. CBS 124048]|nr:putative S1-like domain-containing protein [Xylaria sp. CBS 124048]